MDTEKLIKNVIASSNELLEYERNAKAKAYEKVIHETKRANKWFWISFQRKKKNAQLEYEIKELKEKLEFAERAVDKFFKTEDETDLLKIAEWNNEEGND